jgi:hypothetical protein
MKKNNIYDDLIDQMGGCPDFDRTSTPDDVYATHKILSDREWMCGVYFALSHCFTDLKNIKTLDKLSDIEYSSENRREKVLKIIKELFEEE